MQVATLASYLVECPEVRLSVVLFNDGPLGCELRRRGITPVIARRRAKHGSGLGRVRWVVERTFAWLHNLKRLLVRYERRADMHEALLALGCCLVCYRRLRRSI